MVLGYWTFGTKLGSVLFYRRAQQTYTIIKLLYFTFLDCTRATCFVITETRSYFRTVRVYVVVRIKSHKHNRRVSEIQVQLTQTLVVTRGVVRPVLVFVDFNNQYMCSEITVHIRTPPRRAVRWRKVVSLVAHPRELRKPRFDAINDMLFLDFVVSTNRFVRISTHETRSAIALVFPVALVCRTPFAFTKKLFLEPFLPETFSAITALFIVNTRHVNSRV